MRLVPETSRRIAGQQVELDAEAWGAVQSAQRARLTASVRKSRIRRRRLEIWPEANVVVGRSPQDAAPLGGQLEQGPWSTDWMGGLEFDVDDLACGCKEIPFFRAGVRYVDAEHGDDDDSGELVVSDHAPFAARLWPWRTLRRVQQWIDDLLAEAGERCIWGAEIYLRRGRAWDGTEEWSDEAPTGLPGPWGTRSTILEFQSFKAAEAAPLILSAYGASGDESGTSVSTDGGALGTRTEALSASLSSSQRPLLDGKRASVEAHTKEVQYDDQRVAISFIDCCHVSVSELIVRGFGAGISARGSSKHHTYSNLYLYNLAKVGVHIGVESSDVPAYRGDSAYTTGDAQTRENNANDLKTALQALISDKLYPEDIAILDSAFRSIGYDTVGTDVALGFLATNCTISGNRMVGDAARGLDGVVAQGAASGHLIEGNTICNHRKFCRLTDDRDGIKRSEYKAEFVDDGTDEVQLVHFCSGQLADEASPTVDTDYGYTEHWYSADTYDADPSLPLPYDAEDDLEAYGEGGIALKALWSRTGTSKDTTHIRDNIIWGHPTFSGITVYDACQGVHVYRNRIFQNGTGITVSNKNNKAWYNNGDPTYYERKTEQVYVYKNLVYMNETRGIVVSSELGNVSNGPAAGTEAGTGVVFKVSDGYIYNNTIAHNLWQGVQITNQFGAWGDVDRIFLFGNLILRNARWLPSSLVGPDDPSWDPDDPRKYYTVQVSWEGEMYVDWTAGATTSPTGWSANNCYLGWDPTHRDFENWSTVGCDGDGCYAGGSVRVIRVGRPAPAWWSVTEAQVYQFEEYSSQVTALTALDLVCGDELPAYEGENGDALYEPVMGDNYVDEVRALDYSVGDSGKCQPLSHAETASILRDKGATVGGAGPIRAAVELPTLPI